MNFSMEGNARTCSETSVCLRRVTKALSDSVIRAQTFLNSTSYGNEPGFRRPLSTQKRSSSTCRDSSAQKKDGTFLQKTISYNGHQGSRHCPKRLSVLSSDEMTDVTIRRCSVESASWKNISDDTSEHCDSGNPTWHLPHESHLKQTLDTSSTFSGSNLSSCTSTRGVVPRTLSSASVSSFNSSASDTENEISFDSLQQKISVSLHSKNPTWTRVHNSRAAMPLSEESMDLRIIPTTTTSILPLLSGSLVRQRQSLADTSRGIIIDPLINRRLRADPVQRYKQYETLWKRDKFLRQRNRRKANCI